MPVDCLEALYPEELKDLPVAWDQVKIPGPPGPYRLSGSEGDSILAKDRFRRRTIQAFNLYPAGAADEGHTDRLAFIDKAIPHSLYDLMCTEASDAVKATVSDISRQTGRAVCQSAYNFVSFLSRPETFQTYDLAGGQLHLAVNCDPNTLDRESVQASKRFHMHFLYWRRQELKLLQGVACNRRQTRKLLRQRMLDPLFILGPAMIHERLHEENFRYEGMRLIPFRPDEIMVQGMTPGCLIRLDTWGRLKTEAFTQCINHIHCCIKATSRQLQHAFTGQSQPPDPWQRHALLPYPVIVDNIGKLSFSRRPSEGLVHLARVLRNISPQLMNYLKRRSGHRIRHLVLNNPCYTLNLYSPDEHQIDRPLIESKAVYLSIQVKLLSAIGGAGLLCLKGVPIVRIVREQGEFSAESWSTRARFQRDYTAYNYPIIERLFNTGMCTDYRYSDPVTGWDKI